MFLNTASYETLTVDSRGRYSIYRALGRARPRHRPTINVSRISVERAPKRSYIHRRIGRPIFCTSEEDEEMFANQSLADDVAKALNGTNIYLVGMMGSGKTTVGSVLAKSMKYLFMDTDALLEEAAKCSIQEMFESMGEEKFREMETAVLKDLYQYKNLVVGTGGGIVTQYMNWSFLRNGVIVFLNGPLDKLASRVASDGLSGRPLLAPTDGDEEMSAVDVAYDKLKRLYAERETMYKCADIEVPLDDPLSESGLASVDEVVTRVLLKIMEKVQEKRREVEERRKQSLSGLSNLPGGSTNINYPAEGTHL